MHSAWIREQQTPYREREAVLGIWNGSCRSLCNQAEGQLGLLHKTTLMVLTITQYYRRRDEIKVCDSDKPHEGGIIAEVSRGIG